MAGDILIVSPDKNEIQRLKILFHMEGFNLLECADPANVLQMVRDNDLAISVISSLGEAGVARRLKREIQIVKPNLEVVLLNNFSNIRTSDDVLRHGALDYIVELEDLRRILIYIHEHSRAPKHEDPEALEIKEFFFDLTDLLLSILEIDDEYFSGNNHMVMKLSRKVAKAMNLRTELLDAVTLGSLLRDLGNIGLNKEVLNDARPLTEEEYLMVKEHPQTSVKLVKRLNLPWRVDQVILHHHEAYDGTGYPHNLRGREIPIGARILFVADSYVAMTTDRPYRKAKDPQTALEEIQETAGSRYDPEVVEVFLEVIRQETARQTEPKKKLLVVEDQQFMQALIKIHMVNEGFEVITAGNGAEAMKCVREKKPDIVISDVFMPVMDGFKLCSTLFQDPETRDIPVFLISGNKKRENRVRGLELGAIDYITKPFDLEELSLKAHAVLKRRGEPDETFTHPSGIKGRLELMALSEIVQFLNLGLKTALVEIESEPERDCGQLYFSRGEVTCAETENFEGEEAFYEMLRWGKGGFTIRHGIQAEIVNISKGTMGLLMEGTRLIDEERH